MKKLLLSALSLGVVAVVAIVATQAFFSDEETSTGNTFQAGAIDLQVDSKAHYAGLVCVEGHWVQEDQQPPTTRPDLLDDPCGGTWNLKDLTIEKFFEYSDLKPGDDGENTISLHVYNNDAWGCVTINPTLNDDMSSTEPELEAGDTQDTDSIFDGELAQSMHFRIWSDMCSNTGLGAVPGDNIYQQGCDLLLTEGDGPITPRTWALAAPGLPNVFTGAVSAPLIGSNDYYLGVAWDIPTTVGNKAQTDKYMSDISFKVEQSRHNENFVCPVQEGFTPNTLRLENEQEVQGGPWNVIVDQKYVDMTYNSSGPTFDYTLVGQGLAASTQYSLIYYADGWPGNNPGALIGTHLSNADGTINTGPVINAELNMDLPTLPDGNYAIGAKIWLIPSSAYNAGTKSVTVWPPDFNTWFFEGNVYINYNDTQVP
ncbi:MAG: hypothetical protein UT39_C0008G0041 [Candidatus Woesebacteria bacterium GW2011_GWA1_39_21]|uniref:Uncharacterized protein n=1 Tax=Candidatus Woesebacteria bacterium GW2011_GWA1_39_21 TaxID=1618550 RepID=A0A0G0N7H6_9BACT|nr:MAG: hypothetical protein UT39_C0008G0041 [Candidatus Woesebacteria bacterium GW2011_GWA1_39_21]